MALIRTVLLTGEAQRNGVRPRCAVYCVLAAVGLFVGCGRKSDVPVGDGAEKIRKLTLAYVQYAAANRGVGPADQATLAKFLVQRNHISKEDAETWFISPRDNQPFIVHWGQRPMGSPPVGDGSPQPAIIILESTGADGTRYVANGMVSVKQMTADELAQVAPDEKPSGKSQ